MSEVEFGDPCLRQVRLAREFELHGVAFVKNYEKTVGFTFYSQSLDSLSLTMDDLIQAKTVYDFFKKAFKESLATQPSMYKGFSNLNAEWILKTESKETLLKKIEQVMGIEWEKDFGIILSVHEKKK